MYSYAGPIARIVFVPTEIEAARGHCDEASEFDTVEVEPKVYVKKGLLKVFEHVNVTLHSRQLVSRSVHVAHAAEAQNIPLSPAALQGINKGTGQSAAYQQLPPLANVNLCHN